MSKKVGRKWIHSKPTLKLFQGQKKNTLNNELCYLVKSFEDQSRLIWIAMEKLSLYVCSTSQINYPFQNRYWIALANAKGDFSLCFETSKCTKQLSKITRKYIPYSEDFQSYYINLSTSPLLLDL